MDLDVRIRESARNQLVNVRPGCEEQNCCTGIIWYSHICSSRKEYVLPTYMTIEHEDLVDNTRWTITRDI